jgi:hypothetical protein
MTPHSPSRRRALLSLGLLGGLDGAVAAQSENGASIVLGLR